MADTDTTTPVKDLEGNTEDGIETMRSHFLEHSTIKSNGIREVNKAGYDAALLTQGVSAKEVKRVQDAVDMASSAAALVAESDLTDKISATSKDDLKNDDMRRDLKSTVRIPTYGGKTEVTVTAEKSSPVPFRGGEGEERRTVVNHGVIRTSINGTGRIHKDVQNGIADRMREMLGYSK